MNDFNTAPSLGEIFCRDAAMAMLRRRLRAEEDSVLKCGWLEHPFDAPLVDEIEVLALIL